MSRFDLTSAHVEPHTIRIDPYISGTGDRAHAYGHWFTDKPPVVSFVAAPVYAAVRLAQRVQGLTPAYEAFGTEVHPAVRVVPNKALQQGLYASSLVTNGAA